jgi:putative tryptophan/tyrosine transport system substrate-binding protein
VTTRRAFIGTLAGSLLTASISAEGQQAAKVYKIGVLSAGPPGLSSTNAVFSQSLRELGWIEGKNIVIESRYAEDRLDRLPELAAELVRLNVDVIVTFGTLAPLAAKRATTTIPIVMSSAGDPLGTGLVASLARPGGNITGLSMMVPELGGKRLQMLKEISPAVSRVAILWDAANPYPALVFKETESAARTLGIQLQSLEVRSPGDFLGAFDAAARQRAGALLTVEDPLTVGQRTQIVGFAEKSRLPAMYGLREFVDAGGLISYGVHLGDLRRRAAGYVDKILKGAKPGDLPVEQPTKFELLINLKTAKALGLTIPPSVLGRADEVIQ